MGARECADRCWLTHLKLTKSNQDMPGQTNINATATQKLTHNNFVSDTSTKHNYPCLCDISGISKVVSHEPSLLGCDTVSCTTTVTSQKTWTFNPNLTEQNSFLLITSMMKSEVQSHLCSYIQFCPTLCKYQHRHRWKFNEECRIIISVVLTYSIWSK